VGVSVYLIVQLHVHDAERYGRYSENLIPILAQYGGEVVVADDAPRVVEGEWDGNRVVVLRFADGDAVRAWSTSPEYQAIVGDRHAGARTVATYVRGLP
jgi:uncharacterized protein (DUF1330 family)